MKTFRNFFFSKRLPIFLVFLFCLQIARAQSIQCENLFEGSGAKVKIVKFETDFVNVIKSDVELSLVAKAANSANGTEAYPVRSSQKMMKFRDRMLGLLKIAAIREPLVRSYESYFRIRSYLTWKALIKSDAVREYDLVIVASGVHGLIALHRALEKNPNFKILLVDEGDTAGSTFRYGKELFDINSSLRASGPTTRPLPGLGNLNELPGFAIQVSDLTKVKYPTANDLGSALVIGLFAVLQAHPNVDVIFNSKAESTISWLENNDQFKSLNMNQAISVSQNNGNSLIQIEGQAIIAATGLGTPKIPSGIEVSIKNDPKLVFYDGKNLPKVATVEDVNRIQAMSNAPVAQIKDKVLAIAGGGDSTFTIVQNILGYAAREAYGFDSAQSGLPRKVYVLGLDQTTCEELLAILRSRYANFVTGIRSSSPLVQALVEIIPQKIESIGEVSNDQMRLKLEENVIVEGIDHLILATGYSPNVRSLVASANKSLQGFQSDRSFLNEMSDFIQARTTDSFSFVNVGRKIRNSFFYVLGTAADLFEAESKQTAPAGIVQNFVSIFINAPRVVAGVDQIVKDMIPRARPANAVEPIVLIENSNLTNTFVIDGIQETRIMAGQSMNFLRSTFKDVLTFSQGPVNKKFVLKVSLNPNGTLTVVIAGNIASHQFVEVLASTREFFSLSRELLKYGSSGVQLVFEANTSRDGQFVMQSAMARFEKSEEAASAQDRTENSFKVISNGQIKLRGLVDRSTQKNQILIPNNENLKEQLMPKKPQEKKILGKTIDLMDPKTYTSQAIFVSVPAGKFIMGKGSNQVEATITKSYQLMATPFTHKFYRKLQKYVGESVSVFSLSKGVDRPLAEVTLKEFDAIAARLSQLSRSEILSDQAFMLELFPDHQRNRVYEVPSEAQLERAYQLAKNENGETMDQMILKENNFSQISKYVNIRKRNREDIIDVTAKLPLYLEGQPIFLQGNVLDLAKDLVKEVSGVSEGGPLPGGVDPLGIVGNLRVARGASWDNSEPKLRSDIRFFLRNPIAIYDVVGLRLVATDP